MVAKEASRRLGEWAPAVVTLLMALPLEPWRSRRTGGNPVTTSALPTVLLPLLLSP
jgi:hypothetical protein